MDIMTAIDTIVEKLQEAERINGELQRNTEPGSISWYRHETIDDRLNEVLAALGQ